MIYGDSYFSIGDYHIRSGKPCQDYAITKIQGDKAIAIVSDGCSTGGLTDVGSRLLAHAKLMAYLESKNLDDVILTLKSQMGLNWNDMLATMGFICIDNDSPNQGIITFFGDGYIIIDYVDHKEFIQIKYGSNAPYYYIYRFDNNYTNYLVMQKQINKTIYLDNGNLTIEEITPEQASEGINIAIKDNLKSVTIFSDGIASFTGLNWIDTCKELTQFKNIKGEYLKRRMSRAIQEYKTNDIAMFDDIAGASLYILE